MWIQNKTKGDVIEVTEEKWEDLKKLGWNAHWTVVQYTDKIDIPKSNEVVEIRRSVSKKKTSKKKEEELIIPKVEKVSEVETNNED